MVTILRDKGILQDTFSKIESVLESSVAFTALKRYVFSELLSQPVSSKVTPIQKRQRLENLAHLALISHQNYKGGSLRSG